MQGPYCTMLLADLGAEVIKIEKQGTGDDTHDFQPVKDGESGYFTYLNRNKKSLSLNLKAKESIEIVKELATWADIVVENFSPGVVDRLGVGYKDLKAVNPRIIYGSISGFGQSGPYMNKPAYDLVCQAMGGYMNITGEASGKPFKLGSSIADAISGVHMGLCADVRALLPREDRRRAAYRCGHDGYSICDSGKLRRDKDVDRQGAFKKRKRQFGLGALQPVQHERRLCDYCRCQQQPVHKS